MFFHFNIANREFQFWQKSYGTFSNTPQENFFRYNICYFIVIGDNLTVKFFQFYRAQILFQKKVAEAGKEFFGKGK